MVQGRLKEKLTGRKFLLIMDDVWNEDRDQWKSLQTPLKYGAKGSKILSQHAVIKLLLLWIQTIYTN